jgi:hypothetical protein
MIEPLTLLLSGAFIVMVTIGLAMRPLRNRNPYYI